MQVPSFGQDSGSAWFPATAALHPCPNTGALASAHGIIHARYAAVHNASAHVCTRTRTHASIHVRVAYTDVCARACAFIFLFLHAYDTTHEISHTNTPTHTFRSPRRWRGPAASCQSRRHLHKMANKKHVSLVKVSIGKLHCSSAPIFISGYLFLSK